MTGLATTTTTMAMAAALDAAAAGDEVAFSRIVATYHADMVRVAYGICGDSALALDATQAAWVIAWRKLATVREPDHLRGWLVAVVANEARHLLRRQRPITLVDIRIHTDDGPDPSQAIARLDLADALRRLSPDDRSLIALRYSAGLDSSEIGPLLGISASGVRARLMRLMARLRKELDDDRA
jgi:RNA polymerase sigma-70 factor (ECF subfamily)